MREIGFSEIKRVALDILKDVAHFCDTHDIQYNIYAYLLPQQDTLKVVFPILDL